MPMLNDQTTDAMADRIGRQLIQSIPAALRQPAFRYSFVFREHEGDQRLRAARRTDVLHRVMIDASQPKGNSGVMAPS